MSTWQEQVRQWHDASLAMLDMLDRMDEFLGGAPMCLYERAEPLIEGWASTLAQSHGLDDWLECWAWECRFGRDEIPGQGGHRVELSDGSQWALGSVDDLIAMLEREKQIAEAA